MVKLFVEKYVEKYDELSSSNILVLDKSQEVSNEEEALDIADIWKNELDTKMIRLHYCFHDETPTKSCEIKILYEKE